MKTVYVLLGILSAAMANATTTTESNPSGCSTIEDYNAANTGITNEFNEIGNITMEENSVMNNRPIEEVGSNNIEVNIEDIPQSKSTIENYNAETNSVVESSTPESSTIETNQRQDNNIQENNKQSETNSSAIQQNPQTNDLNADKPLTRTLVGLMTNGARQFRDWSEEDEDEFEEEESLEDEEEDNLPVYQAPNRVNRPIQRPGAPAGGGNKVNPTTGIKKKPQRKKPKQPMRPRPQQQAQNAAEPEIAII